MKFLTLSLSALVVTGFTHFLTPPAFAEATPVTLDEIWSRPDLWEATPEAIEAELAPKGFRWVSATKDSLRAANLQLKFAGRRVYESIVRFSDGKPDSVVVIFFNRGDAGDLPKEAFESLLSEVQSSLSTQFGVPPVDRGRDASGAVKAEGMVWTTPTGVNTLEWSATKEMRAKDIPYRAEFIRLELTPPSNGQARVGATPPPSVKDIVKSFNGKDKVEKSPDGDTFLPHVPMVDQGQKGYCVVASVERVMRYFGATVDQHELAQIANTKTEGGTSPSSMIDSLKKLTMRLGVKVKEVSPFDFRDFLKMVEDYNRLAKREKLPEVKMGSRVVDINDCYSQMNPELLKTLRLKKNADFGKFQRDIQRSIDEGIPVLWSVKLGLISEPGLSQSSGGHMRLITGYNTQTKELIYSDSWGMGHEKKRMSMEDAWTITTSLAIIQPTST
jgi:uncharacterized protein YvpB